MENISIIVWVEKKKRTYLDIPFALDIETTSTVLDTEYGRAEIAFPYVGMFGIDSKVYYFRYLHELKNTLDRINDYLEQKDTYLICLVHFLSYEFAFLSNILDFENVFAVEKNKPIKADYGRIEFRDSYILSGYGLGKLAENFTTTQKLKGDLDYKKIRYPETPITLAEIGYCINDVVILNEYWDYIRCEYLSKSNKKIPLTKTGIVRDDVRLNIPNNKKRAYFAYIKANNPSYDVYKILEKTFQGGYVHANHKHVGYEIKDIDSFDYTSSYPGVMFEYKYPVTKFKKIKFDKTKFDPENNAYLMLVDFVNIRSKSDTRTISFSKILNKPKDYRCDNGRIIHADHAIMWVTETDLRTIDLFYNYTMVGISDCYVSKKGYLPRFILDKVVYYYNQKNKLKGVKGKEIEYLVLKGMLNSIYGMMVTKQDYTNIKWTGAEWLEEPGNYGDDKNQFLLYQWGVWVTSYARYNLLSMVKKIGEDVVYCDTDSIKVKNAWRYLSFFEKDNTRINRLIVDCCKSRNINTNKLKGLGEWEHEHGGKPYSSFITWGAKRYMADGDVTLSGFPKKIMYKGDMVDHMDYLAEKYNKSKLDLFKPPFKLNQEDSGKTVMKYHYSGKATTVYYQYMGKNKSMTLNNWIYSAPTTFKMELGQDFEQLLGYSRYQINIGGYDYDICKGF